MPADALIGRQISEFQITERIGRGGMATVYRAHQRAINRDIALKLIQLDDLLETDDFRARFAQEAAMIASLEHLHILPVYSYGIQDDVAFLAMRLLRGGSLADLMRREPLSLEQTAELFSQFAKALAYAHSKGIVHRDLKPSNILLDEAGNAYLTDFGLAKLIDGEGDLTKSGNIVGTPAYMSPEQLRGDPMDHRSDIYSLGIILYQMVTGRQPFETETSDVISVIYKHLEKMPTPPSEYNPSVTPEVEAVIMRALSKDPAERFSSAGEMANRFKAALGIRASTTDFPVPIVVTPQLPKPATAHRRRPIYIGAAVGGIALIAVLLFFLFRPQPVIAIGEVIEDEIATVEEIEPTPEEIAAAKARLGDNRFIAYLPCNLTSDYNATLSREMMDTARRRGVEMQIYDSDTDKYRQLTLIERARAEGAAAFSICPLDHELLADALRSLQANGYPLTMPLTENEDNYGAVRLSTDNYLMGLMPGRYAGELIQQEMNGEANVVILGYPDLPHTQRRAEGLRDGVLETAPEVEVIGEYLGGTREFAEQSINQVIEEGVEIDAILSINDVGSFGAIRALENAGYDPESVIITSVDAEQLALQYIEDDYFMRGSVELGRTDFATASVDVLIKLLAGSDVPETISIPPIGVITKDMLQARRNQ